MVLNRFGRLWWKELFLKNEIVSFLLRQQLIKQDIPKYPERQPCKNSDTSTIVVRFCVSLRLCVTMRCICPGGSYWDGENNCWQILKFFTFDSGPLCHTYSGATSYRHISLINEVASHDPSFCSVYWTDEGKELDKHLHLVFGPNWRSNLIDTFE